jgi:hypothetical protein
MLEVMDEHTTIESALTEIASRFHAEKWEGEQKRGTNKQDALTEWLLGLAITIPCYYDEITKTAERLHGCKLSDAEAKKVQDKWFVHHAIMIGKLCRKHGVEL